MAVFDKMRVEDEEVRDWFRLVLASFRTPFSFPFSCLPVFLLLTLLSTNRWSQSMLAQGDNSEDCVSLKIFSHRLQAHLHIVPTWE